MKPETVNTEQFIDFIENNQEKFYRIAFSYLKNRDTALDVIHDSIVKALQKKHTIQKTEYFKTWFYRILINECLVYLRKNNRIIYFDNMSMYTNRHNSQPDISEYIDLYQALDKLPIKLKTVVLLRFFEDMKLEEIAQITGVNLSTVKSRLYKALKVLKINMEVEIND